MLIALYSKVSATMIPDEDGIPEYRYDKLASDHIVKYSIFAVLIVLIVIGINLFLKVKYRKYSEYKRIINVVSIIICIILLVVTFFVTKFIVYKHW